MPERSQNGGLVIAQQQVPPAPAGQPAPTTTAQAPTGASGNTGPGVSPPVSGAIFDEKTLPEAVESGGCTWAQTPLRMYNLLGQISQVPLVSRDGSHG